MDEDYQASEAMSLQALKKPRFQPSFRLVSGVLSGPPKVNIDSNLDADKTFVELLGKDPAQRYRFIMDSAALTVAEELDV